MANTTQAQISNIFNLMVQLEPRLNFYHFGWRSDILRNIDNNFDQGVKTGRLFPAVHFAVPEYTEFVDSLQYESLKEEIEVTLYFDNLQDYNNTGTANTFNLLEQWDYLKSIAEDFVINLNFVLEHYNAGFISLPKFEQFSHGHNDRLITWRVTFKLTHYVECTEVQNQIDTSLLPATIEETDLENYKSQGPPPDRCATILGMLTETDICSCIIPTLDFSDSEGNNRDCLTETQIEDLTSWLGAASLAPKMAFSTRLLATGYSGFCMKVRRGSDNSTLDIGFVDDGSGNFILDEAAIVSFCGASIGYVVEWYDQSPNMANAKQTGISNQPQIYDGTNIFKVNGYASIRFANAAGFSAKFFETRYQVAVDLNDDVMFYVSKVVSRLANDNANFIVGGNDFASNNVGFGLWRPSANADQFVLGNAVDNVLTIEGGETTRFDFKLNSFNKNTIRRNGVDVGTYLVQDTQNDAFLVDVLGTAPEAANFVSCDMFLTEVFLQSNICVSDPVENQAIIESEIVSYYNL